MPHAESIFKIADRHHTMETVAVQASQVVRTLTPWFPQAPDAVYAALARLQGALKEGVIDEDAAAYLGVNVDPLDQPCECGAAAGELCAPFCVSEAV